MNFKKSLQLTLSLAIMCLASFSASSQTYVNHAATGANNGTSWANAYTSLQTALANTTSGQIWVAAGNYVPSVSAADVPSGDTREFAFLMKSNVSLYGGFAGTEGALNQRNISANPTVLNGDISGNDNGFTGNGENCYHVIVSANDVNVTIDGFTIRGGNANANGGFNIEGGFTYRGIGGGICNGGSNLIIQNCSFTENNSEIEGGGAIKNINCTPQIINCQFFNNRSLNYSACIHNYGASAIITGCTFSNNTTSGFGMGGGIYNQFYSHGTITNCTFSNNITNSTGNGAGGGIYADNSAVAISGCKFFGNVANRGGGIYIMNFDNSTNPGNFATITNCFFEGNNANQGGALCFQNTRPLVTNCVLANNNAPEGAGIFCIGLNSTGLIKNTTFNNHASQAVYTWSAPKPTLENCIIWGTGASITDANPGTGTIVTYSIVDGGYAGIGNSTADPMFVNAADVNGADDIYGTTDDGLSIQAGSPAINGSNQATTSPTTDIAGNNRTGLFDMGAYEYVAPPCNETVSVSPSTGMITCTNTSVLLQATGSGSGTYSWGGANNAANLTVTSGGTYTVTYTEGGCTATASAVITQSNTAPNVVITPSGATTICPPQTVNLTASGADTYVWSGAFTGSGSTVTASTGGTYTVLATSTFSGCTATASIVVTQFCAPTFDCVSGQNAPLSAPTLALGANPYSQIVATWVNSNPPSGYRVDWRVQGSTSSSNFNTPNTTHTISNLLPGTTYEVRILQRCTNNNTLIFSPWASITTQSMPSCGSATISCGTPSVNGLSINWAPQINAISYRVRWQAVGQAGFAQATVLNGGISSYNIAGLLPNTTYNVWILTQCVNGAFYQSNTIQCTTGGTSPLMVPDMPFDFSYNGIEYVNTRADEVRIPEIEALTGDIEVDLSNGSLTIKPLTAGTQIGFGIVPNPTTNRFEVVVAPSADASAEILLTDLSGQVIMVQATNLNENGAVVAFDTQDLTTGVYLVTVKSATQATTQKLVVLK